MCHVDELLQVSPPPPRLFYSLVFIAFYRFARGTAYSVVSLQEIMRFYCVGESFFLGSTRER